MVVQRHPNLLNRFLAPEIAEFNTADIPDLRALHPEAEHWMSNHFLNNLYRDSLLGKPRQYAVNLLFRGSIQFARYHQARDITLDYLSQSSLHAPAWNLYFAAIAQWETCFLNYQIFVDVHTKAANKKLFWSKDGSEEQRAYDIADAIKHWASRIAADRQHDDDTIPMWLANNGFKTRELSLTYSELGVITDEVTKTADELQDVRTFFAP